MSNSDPFTRHAGDPQTLRELTLRNPGFQLHPDDQWLLDEYAVAFGGQILVEDPEMGGWVSLGRMILSGTPEGHAVIPLKEGGPHNYNRANLEVLPAPRPRQRTGQYPRGVSMNSSGHVGGAKAKLIYQATAPGLGDARLGRMHLGSYETVDDARLMLDIYEKAMLGKTLDQLVGTQQQDKTRAMYVKAVVRTKRAYEKAQQALSDYDLEMRDRGNG